MIITITYREYFKRRSEGETVKSVADSIGKPTRAINRALERGGWVHEVIEVTDEGKEIKDWVYHGELDVEQALDREMIFGKVTTVENKRTSEPMKVRTDEQTNRKTIEPINDMNEQTNEPTNEPTRVVRKRQSFDIDVSLMKKLKIEAVLREKNMYEIVEEAIRQYLNK